jgi:hippurate hydrolase
MRFACFFMAVFTCSAASAGPPASDVNSLYPGMEALYMDLHRNPELAFEEKQTAAKLAARLRTLGYETTTGVGGTGVVGLLKNGAGPVAMLRTELDALPVTEQTGLPFSSNTAGVMHACGHDLHMAAWS